MHHRGRVNKLIYSGLVIVVFIGLGLKFWLIGAGRNIPFTPTMGSTLPVLSGTTLTGDDFTFPDDFEHDLNLIVMGFKRRHQDAIHTWLKPFDTDTLNTLDIGFYEVPVIYEMEFIQRFFLNNAMKFGVSSAAQRRRTITVFLDRSKFLKTMSMQEENIYALLVDRTGKILWMQPGVYDSSKMDTVKAIIAKQRS